MTNHLDIALNILRRGEQAPNPAIKKGHYCETVLLDQKTLSLDRLEDSVPQHID